MFGRPGSAERGTGVSASVPREARKGDKGSVRQQGNERDRASEEPYLTVHLQYIVMYRAGDVQLGYRENVLEDNKQEKEIRGKRLPLTVQTDQHNRKSERRGAPTRASQLCCC